MCVCVFINENYVIKMLMNSVHELKFLALCSTYNVIALKLNMSSKSIVAFEIMSSKVMSS